MTLQPRERRFVLGAIGSLALFLLLQFIVLPRWEQAESDSHNLFQVQKELRSDRELLASKRLAEQVNALRSRLDEQRHLLLSASSANEAGAEFLTWLSSSASQQQLGFVRSEFLTPVPVGDKYQRVPVRMELTGRITQITQFLTLITTTDRLVSIDELDLTTNGEKEKRVRCSVIASALMLKPK